MTRPLSSGQQQFLQQLLSLQVVSDSACETLFEKICSSQYDNEEDIRHNMGSNMGNCIGRINASLVPGFGMEIRTVVLPEYDNTKTTQNSTMKKVRYHAIVNKNSDDVAQQWGAFSKTLHEIAFLKLILQRITESEEFEPDDNDDNDDNDDDNENKDAANQVKSKQNKRNKRGMGSLGQMHKIDLINLRNELEEKHKSKISLHAAEKALIVFSREGWIVPIGGGEESMFQIGPRTYMELPGFMETLMPKGAESLPQFILHRG